MKDKLVDKIPNRHEIFTRYRHPGEYTLSVKGSITEDLLSEIQGVNVTAIDFDAGDFNDLSFLKQIAEDITYVSISTKQLDWGCLNQLRNLRVLRCKNERSETADISALTQLTELSIYGASFVQSMPALTELRKLYINDWTLTDFTAFTQQKKLEEVRIVDARKLRSLEGFNTGELKSLIIDNAPKLTEASALASAAKLQMLQLIRCKAINNYEFLQHLSEVFWLLVYNSAPLPSADCFKVMQQLEILGLAGTVLEDGMLSKLKQYPELKKIEIKNFEHYDITVRELKAFLKQKWGSNLPDIVRDVVLDMN
jgi:hypothetical protein